MAGESWSKDLRKFGVRNTAQYSAVSRMSFPASFFFSVPPTLTPFILSTMFSQNLEVLRDFHRPFRFRNSRTTGILHTIRHVYRSVWPAREDKPRFGAALKRSAYDYETGLLKN